MNTTQTEGLIDQAKGKVKQALGEAFDNENLANEGAADQIKGHAKEAWGNVKEAAGNLKAQHEAEADAQVSSKGHDVRTSITEAAEHAKDAINRGIGHLTGDKPNV